VRLEWRNKPAGSGERRAQIDVYESMSKIIRLDDDVKGLAARGFWAPAGSDRLRPMWTALFHLCI
jgi:hypothetical protein